MARPRKDGLEYFSHDVHASSDKKVEALRMLYGNDGYAFYFILLETIYQEADFELDVSDAETIQILCRKTELTPERFDMILATALKRGCFDKEDYEERGVLTSNGIKKRADVVVKKRVKMQESYKEKVSDAETIQKHDVSAPKEKESKEKESKEKESKEEEIKDSGTEVPKRKQFIHPTLEEVTTYCYERGNRVDPENWYDHYTSNGWKVGKNQMKDWKAAVRTWEKNGVSSSKTFQTKADETKRQLDLLNIDWKEGERLESKNERARREEVIELDQDSFSIL